MTVFGMGQGGKGLDRNKVWALMLRGSRHNRRDRETMTRRQPSEPVTCQVTGKSSDGAQASDYKVHADSRTPNCVSRKGPFELGFIG